MTRANLGKRGGIALLALFSSVALAAAIFAPSALAASCGGVETAVIDCSGVNDTTGSPVVAVLALTIQILTGLVGITAIGALIYAGILYSSASGNASQVAKAKELIANTVVGLVLFAGMAVLLNWLIPGGLFSGSATFGAGGNGESGKYTGAGGFGRQDVTPPDSKNTINITVATYNIRASNLTAWDNVRANSIFAYMKTVDIVGIQEGRDDSNAWLTSKMKGAGYGRTTLKANGARQIFYNVKKFTLIKQGSLALNSQKDITWVKLKEKTSGTQFYVADVHLSVASSSVRMPELKKGLPYITNTLKDAPLVFIGDMNAKRGSSEDKLIKSYGFKDLYDVAASKSNLQYRTTVPNFKGGTTGSIQIKQHQVDHIYIKGNLSPKAIAIMLHKGSDHLPVQGTIGIADNRQDKSKDGAISLQGVQNFRDVAALNSSLIKPGVIYRSAKLAPATASDKSKLANTLKNGVIIDLRVPSAISSSPDPPISGVAHVNYPVTGVASASGYVDAFVTNAADRKQLGLALTKIANANGPVLIHCAAGKDRTGWLTSMLLYIAGATDQQVMAEYLKSNDAGAGFTVDRSWLNAALSAARKNNDGSIMTYITSPTNGLGVSQATVNKLKAKIHK